MINIGSEQKQDYQFELVIQVRDAQGNPTGKTKAFLTNKADELETYYNRNSGRLKKKKKKAEAATTDKQVTEGLKEVENHIQKIRKQKKLED
jgi:Tfp pilus assembly protein PilE